MLSKFPEIIPHAVSNQMHIEILATKVITFDSLVLLCNELFRDFMQENFFILNIVILMRRDCVRQKVSSIFTRLWRQYQTNVTNADLGQLCEITYGGPKGHLIIALRVSFTDCETDISHRLQATGYNTALMSCAQIVEFEAGLHSCWFSFEVAIGGDYLLCCEIANDERELNGREALLALGSLKTHMRDLGFALENVY